MNLRRKLLMCNAHIKFNKTCQKENLVAKYALISNSTYSNNSAARQTKTDAQEMRVRYEVKLLYKKKQLINKELNKIQLHNANEWGRVWENIEQNIQIKLQLGLTNKHNTQQAKLNKLRIEQKSHQATQETQHIFYPKLTNRTNIQLTHNETQLLNKGPGYNLQYTSRKWIETLAIEAETAISIIEETKQNHLRHMIANTIKVIAKRKKENNNIQSVSKWKTLKKKIRGTHGGVNKGR
jgi:hypothetical protein